MSGIVKTTDRESARLMDRLFERVGRVVMVAAIVSMSGWSSAYASGIFGTLSNFDIYNTTPEPSEGAEIELEGVHASDVGGDYPAHYSSRTITEYADASNNFAGTRITYTGYNFAGAPTPGSLLPNLNPTSTNGHALTYSAGGEHFGFWLNGAQPTATRFFWLNNNAGTYERIGNLPETVPGPTWAYVPPANPGDVAVVQAVIKVPEPAEVIAQKPDSTWMKIYKTKLKVAPNNLQDLLEDLVSGDPNDPNIIVPQEPAETETEWELLEGGKNPAEKMKADEIVAGDKIILRRYEFYEYTGPVDEENGPISVWEDIGNPLDPGLDVLDDLGNVIFTAERGDFIAANMVAAVLVNIPEPSSVTLLSMAAMGCFVRKLRRRRMNGNAGHVVRGR